MGTLKFEDGDNTWTRDGAIVKTALILGATDTMTTREKICSLCPNTWKLLGLLLLLFPSHVFAALPTGSYLRFSRPEHCGGIDFGDGHGLPDGDFTLSVWLTLEGGYARRTVLDSNYKFDFISKFTKVDDGYVDTLFFGGTSYTSLPIDSTIRSQLDQWEWVHNVVTYNRTTDLMSFYNNGIFTGNNTNNLGSPTWRNSSLATKFGHFGKVSNDNNEGIEAIGVGCKADDDTYLHRGGLDDLAIYDGVLSAEEVLSLYDDTGPFDPTADSRLALYYSFDDPSSNTVLNEAPRNSEKYPLILGADMLSAKGVSSEDQCNVQPRVPPNFVCHSFAEPCPDIPPPSNPPIEHPNLPDVSCTNGGTTAFPVYRLAYERDGEELKYQVRTLPQHGHLFEENIVSRLPTEMHRSTQIVPTNLPYNQTEFNTLFLRYTHAPSDPFDVKTLDSFVVAFTDGTNWTEVTVPVTVMKFNQLPEPTNTTINIKIGEDKAISHALSFVDFDSSVLTVVAEEIPTHGILTYATGSETKQLSAFIQYNPYGIDIPEEHYATKLVSYSSHWYNADGDWAADKILGESSTTVYTDTPLSWCPESKTGTGISRNDNEEVGREDYWDRDLKFAEEGYTEYIEVEFDTAVYASEIEIGENRGCGSIVHILAKNSETGLSMSVLERRKADETCDHEDGRARQTKVIVPFTAPKFCNSPFLVDQVRIELDTRTIADWNELDYVKLTGYKNLPSGVLPPGVSQVTYTPDPNYFGGDQYSFYATDCGYHSTSTSEVAEYLVDVEGIPDAPVLVRISLEVDKGNATKVVDMRGYVTNLDNVELTLQFLSLPSVGLLRTIGGEPVKVGFPYNLSTTTFLYEVADFPNDDTIVEFRYEVVDAEQGLTADEVVEVNITGASKSWLTPEVVVAIVGIPVVVLLFIIFTNRKKLKKTRESLKREVNNNFENIQRLTSIKVKHRSISEENEALKQKVKLFQKYSKEELEMIDAQIDAFREKMEMKEDGRFEDDLKSLLTIIRTKTQTYSEAEMNTIEESKIFIKKCRQAASAKNARTLQNPDPITEMKVVYVEGASDGIGLSTTVVDASVEECAAWVHTDVYSEYCRRNAGKDYDGLQYQVKILNDHSLVWYVTRDPRIPLFAPREFRLKGLWSKIEGGSMIVDYSDTKEEHFTESNTSKGPKAVLGSCKSTWLFEPLDPVGSTLQTRATFATKIGFKGRVPTRLIYRIAANSLLNIVSILRTYFIEEAKIEERTDIKKLLIKSSELKSEFVIGKGSFGEVHKSKYRGSHVAVKTLHNIDKENLDRFQAEILLMSDLHHSHIVQLIGACWDKELMALVMEFCERGTSSDVLKAEKTSITWEKLLPWCSNTASALLYLHGMTFFDDEKGERVLGIIHRDLKPENCLITRTYTVKVADFGEARAFHNDNTMTQVGTPLYIAPEIARGDKYSTQADVFSFALTMLSWALKGRQTLLTFLFTAMLTEQGRRVDPKAIRRGASRVSHAMISRNWRPERTSLEEFDVPSSVKDLIMICWNEDPRARPTFYEIVEYLEREVRQEILALSSRTIGPQSIIKEMINEKEEQELEGKDFRQKKMVAFLALIEEGEEEDEMFERQVQKVLMERRHKRLKEGEKEWGGGEERKASAVVVPVS